jgi:Flp pilus assembly protein TadG
MTVRTSRKPARRRGVAAVETACLAPLLVFLFVIGADFARSFFYGITLSNGARVGALKGCDPNVTDSEEIKAAVLAELTDVTPAPTVAVETSTDGNGVPHVTVRVRYAFSTIVDYPGVPSAVTIERYCTMRVLPLQPKPGTY